MRFTRTTKNIFKIVIFGTVGLFSYRAVIRFISFFFSFHIYFTREFLITFVWTGLGVLTIIGSYATLLTDSNYSCTISDCIQEMNAIKKREEELELMVKEHFKEQAIRRCEVGGELTLWQLSKKEREMILNRHKKTLEKIQQPKELESLNLVEVVDIQQDLEEEEDESLECKPSLEYVELEISNDKFNKYYENGRNYALGKILLFFLAMFSVYLEHKFGRRWVCSSPYITAVSIQSAWADDMIHKMGPVSHVPNSRPMFVIGVNYIFFQTGAFLLDCLLKSPIF